MNKERCYECGKKVAWTGVWVNLLLCLLKFGFGIAGGSKAVIADGLHSASCIITAGAIMVSHRLAAKKRNTNFQYGFGKAEFLTAAFVSLLIVIMAIVVIFASIKHLLHSNSPPPHWSTLAIAIISVGANEMLFRYMRCVGTRLKSQTILANAWANRADCFSSIAVILGVMGAMAGIPHLDPIAALFVVAVIIKISSSLVIDSVRALMDGSVNDIYGEEIKDFAMGIHGVERVSELKTRRIGRHVWVDMDIEVDPCRSLAEGHSLSERVSQVLRRQIPDLEQVRINIKPSGPDQCM